MTVDPHAPGDQGRHAEQSRKVEDIRPHNNADACVLVSRNDRRNGRRDLRCVGPERRHHPEQRFREAKPLANPIELPGQHDTRSHGEYECGRK